MIPTRLQMSLYSNEVLPTLSRSTRGSLTSCLVSTLSITAAALVTVLVEAVWESGAPTEDIDIKADQSIPWSFQKLLARRDEPNVLETDKYVF